MKTEIRGVIYNKKTNKYEAKITFNGKFYYLGSYENKEEAINARKEAENKLYPPKINLRQMTLFKIKRMETNK